MKTVKSTLKKILVFPFQAVGIVLLIVLVLPLLFVLSGLYSYFGELLGVEFPNPWP